MNAALGTLLTRVAQGDISAHEAKAIACSYWLGGNHGAAEDLSAFAVELKKLRDKMQTDRYALSVASRPVEEIEKILQSPHLDANTRARIKNFSFGKRYGNVGALVFKNRPAPASVKARREAEAAGVGPAFSALMAQPSAPAAVPVKRHPKGYFFQGPLTSEDLEAARKSWAGQWPWVKAFLDATPQPLVSPRRPKSPRSQPRGKRAPLRRPSTTRGRR